MLEFEGCRPLFFIDGTFLKAKHKGCMLAATRLNGDGGMFLLFILFELLIFYIAQLIYYFLQMSITWLQFMKIHTSVCIMSTAITVTFPLNRD